MLMQSKQEMNYCLKPLSFQGHLLLQHNLVNSDWYAFICLCSLCLVHSNYSINVCWVSKELKGLNRLEWVRKGGSAGSGRSYVKKFSSSLVIMGVTNFSRWTRQGRHTVLCLYVNCLLALSQASLGSQLYRLARKGVILTRYWVAHKNHWGEG